MQTNEKVGVIGHGSWGTAIVKMLCEQEEVVHWWVRDKKTKDFILDERHNPRSLTSVEFDLQKIQLTNDLKEIVRQCDWLVLAVPSIYIHKVLQKCPPEIKEKKIVSAVKGIVPEKLQVIGEYLHSEFDLEWDNFLALGGPCHAEEVAMERLSYLTIAADKQDKAEAFAKKLRSDFIRVTTNTDTLGVEYGSVLKNIYALAAGMAHGLGYGDNFQAVLMSNAIREMERFVQHLSAAESRNISDSVYLGDLLVTGYSFFSRNRMLGTMVGKGYTVKSAIMEMQMVAEGYYATKAIYEIKATEKLKIPIVSAVHKVLYRNENPKKVFAKLIDKLD